MTGLGLGSSEEGYRQDLLRIDERERKLMNGRRPDWRVRFAFYGDKKKEALAMASIGWKKRADQSFHQKKDRNLQPGVL